MLLFLMSDSWVERGKVGKNWRLYPPRAFVRKLKLEEGGTVLYVLEDGVLRVEPVPDPLELAVKAKKFFETTVREFEEESLKEQQLWECPSR